LIFGAVVGYVVLWVVWYLGRQEGDIGAQVVAAVLNMAVFAAVLAYTLQAVSFVLLRRNLPNIERPYLSPWGQAGAMIAGVIALVALVSIFLNEDYRPGVYGVAVYFLLGIIYFAIAGRHRLVLSPEEEFALTQGEAGVPVGQQFSASAEEQERILGGGSGTTPTPPVE
jgi:ethanolamine permease